MFKKNLKIIILICTAIVIAACVIFRFVQLGNESQKFVKLSYLPIYKTWHAKDVPGDLLTDVNLAFGEIAPDFTLQVNPIKELNLPKELEILRQSYPDLKIKGNPFCFY